MIKTILVFLIIFSVIVVLHEFGHFFWAKRAGILVREFALGMGPKLFSGRDKEGTTYTIRMLPLGGYVRLAGLAEEEDLKAGQALGLTFDENDRVVRINASDQLAHDELPLRLDSFDLIHKMELSGFQHGNDHLSTYIVDDKAELIETDGTRIRVAPLASRYESASVWNKILTNFGGPLNNFILAIIAFGLVGLLIPGVPTDLNRIGQVVEDSPAAQAGLKAGDYITKVADEETHDWASLTEAIAQYPNQEVELEIVRDDLQTNQKVKLASNSSGQGSLGIMVYRSQALIDRLLFGFTATWSTITLVLSALAGLFTKGFNLNMLGGPVAMAQATSVVASQGIVDIISFLAALSVNLGIVNLIPIPALDGGKIVLNLIEAVRGKPLSQEKEGLLTLIGFVFMLILMVAVTWNDLMRAFF